MQASPLLFFFTHGFLNFAFSAATPSITTPCGIIDGVYTNLTIAPNVQLEVYRAIPYAEPPVGKLRWQPTVDSICWPGKGHLNATSVGNACMQWQEPYTPPAQSEDCLTLDVFVKRNGKINSTNEKSPVLVWIHGGDSLFGDSEAYGDVQNLLVDQESAVLVVIQFRLNAFGMLATRELSKNDVRGVSGNYGTLDQQSALRWVQSNIGYFSGDKSKVVILGQSSGGTSIYALMASKASTNLFAGAISLSGSPNISMSLAQAEQQNVEFVNAANCTGRGVECLYDLTTQQVLGSIPLAWNSPPGFPAAANKGVGLQHPGVVIADGVTVIDLLTAYAIPMIDVPFVISTTGQETNDFSDGSEGNWTIAYLNDFLHKSLLSWGEDTVNSVKHLYGIDKTPPTDPVDLIYYNIQTDLTVMCGNIALAKQQALFAKTPVYSLTVSKRPVVPVPESFPVKYAYHNIDYEFASQTFAFWLPNSYKPAEEDVKFGAMLRNMWWEMARTGVPPLIKPIKFSIEADQPVGSTVNIITENGTLTAVPNPYTEKCKLWKQADIWEQFWWAN